MSRIPADANAHLISSDEDAMYLESVALELRAVANSMNSSRLLKSSTLPNAWPGELVKHDPGFEGVVAGLNWDISRDKWVPVVKLDHSSAVLFPNLASIAALILESGHDIGQGLEEHVLTEVEDNWTVFDDQSVVECVQDGAYRIYAPGEWTITATPAHPSTRL